MIYDSLDEHLAEADDIAEAATPAGMLLAWCVGMQLISNEFAHAHEREILRVRMQELKGSELLISCGGDLRSEMFNAAGQTFLERYHSQYLQDYQATFGRLYGVRDDWSSYNKIAKVLTAHYMARGKSSSGLKLKLPKWLRWGSQ